MLRWRHVVVLFSFASIVVLRTSTPTPQSKLSAPNTHATPLGDERPAAAPQMDPAAASSSRAGAPPSPTAANFTSFFPLSVNAPPRTARRFAALLTYLRDDETHFMVWLQHYRRHFDVRDIFVLDNMSRRPIASLGLGVTVREFECAKGKYFDHYCLIRNVKRGVGDLLRFYERVVFTEVDELMAARGGLRNLMCNQSQHAVLRPVGFELLQAANETRLDYAAPILPQRTIGAYNLWYNKPAIVQKVLPFTIGFHNYDGAPRFKRKSNRVVHPEVNPYMYLIHLKHADVEFCVERKLWQKQQDFLGSDVAKGFGAGALLKKVTDVEELRQFCTIGPHDEPSKIIHISTDIREAFAHPGGHVGWCETSGIVNTV